MRHLLFYRDENYRFITVQCICLDESGMNWFFIACEFPDQTLQGIPYLELDPFADPEVHLVGPRTIWPGFTVLLVALSTL